MPHDCIISGGDRSFRGEEMNLSRVGEKGNWARDTVFTLIRVSHGIGVDVELCKQREAMVRRGAVLVSSDVLEAECWPFFKFQENGAEEVPFRASDVQLRERFPGTVQWLGRVAVLWLG